MTPSTGGYWPSRLLTPLALQELVHDGSPASRTAVAKARVAAAFAGQDLSARVADGLDASPVLHAGDLSLSGGNAIARRLAASAAGRLYPRAPFDDASRQLAAEIDAWMDYVPTLNMVRASNLSRSCTSSCLAVRGCSMSACAAGGQRTQGAAPCSLTVHTLLQASHLTCMTSRALSQREGGQGGPCAASVSLTPFPASRTGTAASSAWRTRWRAWRGVWANERMWLAPTRPAWPTSSSSASCGPCLSRRVPEALGGESVAWTLHLL